MLDWNTSIDFCKSWAQFRSATGAFRPTGDARGNSQTDIDRTRVVTLLNKT